MIRRPPRSTPLYSSAASDVYKRQVKIPVGLKTPIHTHPSPMLIHVTRGRLKHVRGEEINFFKAGDAFIESNNGGAHYVKNVGKKPAILHVGVVSVVGMPTAINK